MKTAFGDCTEQRYQVLVPVDLFGYITYVWQMIDPDVPLAPQVKGSIGYRVRSNNKLVGRYIDYRTAKLGARVYL